MSARILEPKMISYLDDKLKDNGLVKEAIKTRKPRIVMAEALKACVGIREANNRNDGPMVELIQETIGDADNEAWCMAFIQTGIGYAELKTEIPSAIFASEHCMTVWRKSPKILRVNFRPLMGAIAIWNYEGSDRGHTGLVLSSDEEVFYGVEGNTTKGQTASGAIVREGGGVYFTERSMQEFPYIKTKSNMKLVGFLKPF